MITLKHNNGLPIETKTVKVPKTYVASHSNATELIFFETQEEYDAYMLEHFPPIENLEEDGENN